MKDTQDVTACVIEPGIYFDCAQRLARGMKKVYYHRPTGEAFPTFAEGCMGDGHPDVEMLFDFWPKFDEIDLFVFPDCGNGGLQVFLEQQGKAVWGGRNSDRYEKQRGLWLKTCEEFGLPMPATKTIRGLSKLREYLSDRPHEKHFIKISTWRGDMETWAAVEPAQVENKLDVLAMKFGPMKEILRFYVQSDLKTTIEGGSDTYFVAGDYPDKIILGYEKKDESYLATWLPRSEMPEEIWRVSETLKPLLERERYCNLVSTEVRVKPIGKEERVGSSESFCLDPCFRFPSPAGEEQLEWYLNFPDIVWRGANGQLVQPQMLGKFAGEAIISYHGDREGWKSIEVPDEVRQWVKLYACAYHQNAYHFKPAQAPECIGCAVAIADDPEDVITKLKEIQEAMASAAVTLHIEAMADLIKEIATAEEKGIHFTHKEMPEPAAVLEDN